MTIILTAFATVNYNFIINQIIIQISKTVERLRRKARRACKMVASCNVFISIRSDRRAISDAFFVLQRNDMRRTKKILNHEGE